MQDLLRASGGTNLGVDYLPGALDLDRPGDVSTPHWRRRVLWFDALVGNVDRSWRNPNMLLWHGRAHLIDHGATLTFHHSWPGASRPGRPGRTTSKRPRAGRRCDPTWAPPTPALAPLVDADLLEAAVAEVPDVWLDGEPGFDSAGRGAPGVRRSARCSGWLPATTWLAA